MNNNLFSQQICYFCQFNNRLPLGGGWSVLCLITFRNETLDSNNTCRCQFKHELLYKQSLNLLFFAFK